MRLSWFFFGISVIFIGFGGSGCDMFQDGVPDNGIEMDETSTWLTIQGGDFSMGDDHLASSGPEHDVYVHTFQALRTEVTVGQYAACVNSGACTIPGTKPGCNWGQAGFEQHPINCVTWQQAKDYCISVGGRLLTEAEWEYAARAGGDRRSFPWGMDAPSCDFAVMFDNAIGIEGCGVGGTWPVCSKPEGRTDHGMCDMAGNVNEWVEDVFHMSYTVDAPIDGSAWLDGNETESSFRVLRGAAFNANFGDMLHVANRANDTATNIDAQYGIRCAR